MMKNITQDQFKIMPWKNGGGSTTEMFRIPGRSLGDFYLRLSQANIEQDGPFSVFSGIDRYLILLEGQGCILNTEGHIIELTPDSPPYFFAGEKNVHCKLLYQTITDFNVMIDRNWGKAIVHTGELAVKTDIKCSHDMTLFFNRTENQLYEMRIGDEFESNACKFITINIDLF
jgi:environmental stress-induced protein Ves